MVGLVLRVVLAILVFRVLGGLFRAIAGGSRPESGRRVPQPPKPLVDRASAIDVPFTEEREEG
jgi:hypothetical protein